VGILDAVLLKPGRLTHEEYELIKQHTIIGDRLCGELRSLAESAPNRPPSRRAVFRVDRRSA
jgi:putative two-component system response regulator